MSGSTLDYSKWDHIEISDDEDDTHPNIDTPSLFRWRHQARVERMAERQKEKEELEKDKESIESMRKQLMKQALNEADKKVLVEKLKKQEDVFKKKEVELSEKEKSEPWNIDTICKEGFSKSSINKTKKEDESKLTDEEQMNRHKEYTDRYSKELKTFGMTKKIEESKKYLVDHPYLVCEKAANYLAIWCIDLEVEEKHALMETVANQTMLLQFILELAKTLKTDPRNCFVSFFTKFQAADEAYMNGFNDELRSFKTRVRGRAKARIRDAMAEIEKEEREKRLGPGGLDPHEVFESLPPALQECFEKREVGMLQKVIAELDPEEAKVHMKRCVDSGLWVPGGGEEAKGDAERAAGAGGEAQAVYEEIEQAETVKEKEDA